MKIFHVEGHGKVMHAIGMKDGMYLVQGEYSTIEFPQEQYRVVSDDFVHECHWPAPCRTFVNGHEVGLPEGLVLDVTTDWRQGLKEHLAPPSRRLTWWEEIKIRVGQWFT